MINKDNIKMININTKKHLVMMNFPKVLDLPAILITAMLHLMLLELLMMAMVLLQRKLLPEMFLVTILHPLRPKIKAVLLMLDMEHQLELELKVNHQPQELLMKSTVLLVSMRGARVVFPSLLWKEDKNQKLQHPLKERMVVKTPKCVLEGPWISVCRCARVSLPGCMGPVCRAVRTGAWSR